jgi:hypothetical protein
MNTHIASDHRRPTAITRAIRERRRITIRPAAPEDAAAIRRLAALASRPVPAGPLTLAETEDGLVAALGPAGAVTDPFRLTEDVVELLRLRAAQLAA